MKLQSITFITTISLFLLGACTKDNIVINNQDAGSGCFYAYLPSSGDGTKTFIDRDGSIYWNKADRISVFRSLENECFEYTGMTGEIGKPFIKVKDGTMSSNPMWDRNYAVYPYSTSNISTQEGIFSIVLPVVQHYAEDSFGLGDNTMASVTENLDDAVFHFKNACGFILLKLYGGSRVKKITLKGNNGEKISGSAKLTVCPDSVPLLSVNGNGTEEIHIDCEGEGGILTGGDKEHATQFWFVVPPVTFSNGFAVEVTGYDGTTTTKIISRSVTITPNCVQPMSAFKVKGREECEMLSFSLTDGTNTYSPFELNDGNIRISVPNHGDFKNLKAVFTHNGASVTVDGVEQVSSETVNDFSDFAHPVKYTVTAYSGKKSVYEIVLFDLPTLIIDTPNPITSKTVWTEGCSIKLVDTDGSITDLGKASVRGRGNSSWTYPKRPYTFKLETKPKTLLGMPGDKRWNLLNNYLGYTPNITGHEIARRTESIEWSPRCRIVELILNGQHLSGYTLIEHIKIAKNRVNIKELKTEEITYPAVSGGYLIELDAYYDDQYKFRSSLYNLPVNLKSPDENVPQEQMDYIKNFFTELETSLKNPDKFAAREFEKYIDLESFADVWMTRALTDYNSGDFSVPRSARVYKGRDGIDSPEGTIAKLKGGPCWDFDGCICQVGTLANTGAWYYKELFKDEQFVQLIKDRWPAFKANLEGQGSYPQSIYDWVDEHAKEIDNSTDRDLVMWPNAVKFIRPGQTVKTKTTDTQKNLPLKVKWLDEQIQALSVK